MITKWLVSFYASPLQLNFENKMSQNIKLMLPPALMQQAMHIVNIAITNVIL